jgi:hypothetical protein
MPMPTPTLDQEIQSRIQSFLAELSDLVKMAALGSVHAALGGEPGPRMRRGPGRPRGSGKRGPGRPRKAAAARMGKRIRRSAEDLEAIAARVLAHVKANAGHRLEQIGAALKTDTAILKRPIANLLAMKHLRTEGQKRGTKYFARSGRGAPGKSVRKAKRTRKAKVTRRTPRKKAARRARPGIVRPARSQRGRSGRNPSHSRRPGKARALADALALQAATIPGAPL